MIDLVLRVLGIWTGIITVIGLDVKHSVANIIRKETKLNIIQRASLSMDQKVKFLEIFK